MIEIVQAGQVGKTNLLLDMHRLRARVFKDQLQWEVDVDPEGLEVDRFDMPETVYLLGVSKSNRVVGSWRLLPSSGPTMLHDIWPQFLETLPMPSSEDVYEVSRFAVSAPEEEQAGIVGEMFCGLTELCLAADIKEIFTLYDEKVARIIRRLDCQPYATSDEIEVAGVKCRAGAFKTDLHMLARLSAATGIKHSLVQGIELPPALSWRINK